MYKTLTFGCKHDPVYMQLLNFAITAAVTILFVKVSAYNYSFYLHHF